MTDPKPFERQARLRVNWRGKVLLQFSRQVRRFDGSAPYMDVVWEDATVFDLLGTTSIVGPMTVVRK